MNTTTFWEHLGELRKVLVRVICIVALGFGCAFYFSENILSILTKPLKQDVIHQEIRKERILNTGSQPLSYSIGENSYQIPAKGFIEVDRIIPHNLVILSPLEGILTTFKISVWVGLVFTSPVWIFYLMQFVIPALYDRERQAIAPIVILSLIFLAAGFLFAFYITIPLANQYLFAFNMGIGQNLWTLSSYLDYTLFLLLANAFAFELGLILLLLVHYNVLNAEKMIAMRRHMIVLAFILGAILTPPDVLTQLMLAIPLIGLYELTLIYARLRTKQAVNIISSRGYE